MYSTDDLLKEFRAYCGFIREEEIVSWSRPDRFTLVVKLVNGEYVEYEYVEHQCKLHKSYDEMIEFHLPKNKEDWLLEFARRIYKKIWESGWGQELLASQIDISQGTLSNYVNGFCSPNAYTLSKLASFLGWSDKDLAYIMCLTPWLEEE